MLKVDVHKAYSSHKRKIKMDYSFEVDLSVTTALYGKSGVGKSSLLRMIAGLDKPDNGKISFNDVVWFDASQRMNMKTAARNLGFVFQDYNLFPNMTVEGNLKYASPNKTISTQVMSLLASLDLKSLMPAYPHELSGGQRQRIALLRALCQTPQLLLLDEPFSALDDESIAEFIREIKQIQMQLNTTIIVVSHRKDVIFKMADEVIHLSDNGTIKKGKPSEVLTRDL